MERSNAALGIAATGIQINNGFRLCYSMQHQTKELKLRNDLMQNKHNKPMSIKGVDDFRSRCALKIENRFCLHHYRPSAG